MRRKKHRKDQRPNKWIEYHNSDRGFYDRLTREHKAKKASALDVPAKEGA